MESAALTAVSNRPSPCPDEACQSPGCSVEFPFVIPALPAGSDSDVTEGDADSSIEEPLSSETSADSTAEILAHMQRGAHLDTGSAVDPVSAVDHAPSPSNSDRLRSLLAKYETKIRQAVSERAASAEPEDCSPPSDTALHEPQPATVTAATHSRRRRGASLDNRRGRPQQRGASLQTTRQPRVQKKRASTGKSQEFELLRLAGARRRSDGSLECKTVWKPTWVAIEDLLGQRALEEAEVLIVSEFGEDAWQAKWMVGAFLRRHPKQRSS